MTRTALPAQPQSWVKLGTLCRTCSEPLGSALVELHQGVCLTCQTLRELGLVLRAKVKK